MLQYPLLPAALMVMLGLLMDHIAIKVDWKFVITTHGSLCALEALDITKVGLPVDSLAFKDTVKDVVVF